MDPRKIMDKYHLCFQKLLKIQQLLKTRVILILNFTRTHAITYTNLNLYSFWFWFCIPAFKNVAA